MRVVVASGKGGTGKTTLATALAQVAAETQAVRVLDCDVEAPNAALFLRPPWSSGAEVTRPVPRVDAERCTACGRCAEVCQFNALAVVAGAVLVFDELCHGCGRCTWICPEQAIHEEPLTVGQIEAGWTPEGIDLAQGLLRIGQPMGLPVLRALKHWQVDPIACEGCGACLDRCPSEALSLVAQTVGACRRSETPYDPLHQAHLNPGQENSGSWSQPSSAGRALRPKRRAVRVSSSMARRASAVR